VVVANYHVLPSIYYQFTILGVLIVGNSANLVCFHMIVWSIIIFPSTLVDMMRGYSVGSTTVTRRTDTTNPIPAGTSVAILAQAFFFKISRFVKTLLDGQELVLMDPLPEYLDGIDCYWRYWNSSWWVWNADYGVWLEAIYCIHGQGNGQVWKWCVHGAAPARTIWY
jgi:hypothetical protein